MSLGGQEDSAAVITYGPDGKAYGSPAQAKAAGVDNATMSAPQTIAPAIQQFNPMGEASLGVITYGPDGRAYGSPAEARNAGVSNPTMSPPAGIPISYPGRQPYTPAPLPGIPTQSSGGRNRYAEIMSQYRQSQPYSFTGMPPSYTGGYGGYPSSYTGGFTPYQRAFTPQPMLPLEGTISATAGGGGGRVGEREAPSAFSLMSPAERAAYYQENPTEGKIALGMQDAFGYTLLGALSKNAKPDAFYDSRLEKQGYDPKQFAYGPPDLRGGFVSTPDTQAVQNAINSTDFSGMDRGGGGGGGYGGGGDGAAGRGEPGGDRGGWGRGGGYAKGGYVSMMHLGGLDPEGPDDGYAALKDGEYVINDKAVKKYGIELMNAINSGKISKGKLRGLLEM
jgi:hypothetical protein